MTDRPQLRIIAYDVSSDKRRRRIARHLESRACRVQESVFEARLTDRQAQALMDSLLLLTGPDDNLRIYCVPDSALPRCLTDGGPQISDGGRFWLL